MCLVSAEEPRAAGFCFERKQGLVPGLKNLKKGEILFREGDQSDAMYVIKSGKIAILKNKGTSEVLLAELGPGDMLGEMAFFDNRPRSAGAKAAIDSVVIELPFKALNAQFKTFPEWLKAIVRTVNNHLRSANQKIKNLEKSIEEETEYFPPHTVTRLMAVLGLVAAKFGADTEAGNREVPSTTLRRYTIQVFQLPTAKMQRLMEILQTYNYMKIEDLGEDRLRLTLFDPDFIMKFTDFYNDWLFKSEDKKVAIWEKELKPLKALAHFGKKETPNSAGLVRVNLTKIQSDCQTELGFAFEVSDIDSLVEKKVIGEKLTVEGNVVTNVNPNEMALLHKNWELIHAFKRVQKDP